ncbi:nuclear transport factor 2 family protein [Sphingomonas abietis]|uniref:Nuclear transport factor 2 family protein n=1 Tax=Sphingomonas abietis TaxID=3012344 RepID=A0ABY7NJQ8_9SPHN|nr:nuclear transport factor 2 family protein [Sphingomonas abietis]WBO21728.1 nuclear transport factor 2 family protein [Sphingomonas abietis]
MTSIANLLLRNLHDVFGEGAPSRRRAAVEDIFHEDAAFHEPNGVQRGWDAIDRIAGAIRATHPDYVYTVLREPEVLGEDAGRVQWVSGPPGGAPEYAGTDIVVARDGRIAAVYLFFDAVPA